jgi:hypothetical protein
MSEMNWTVSVQMNGGTTLTAAAGKQAVEATDSIEVTLAADTDQVVEIQPGGASAIQLLVIKSSVYGDALTYTVSDGTNDSESVKIDAPQVFSRGSVSLFGVDPHQLKLSNDMETAATILILVARDATL